MISNTDHVGGPDDPLAARGDRELPGSGGEHLLQAAYGTAARAEKFYDDQVLDHLNEQMIEFVGRMDMAFIATSDATGECDCSLRAGPAGFLQVIDERTIAYPEYRGNGVLASLGNISENPSIGVLVMDFVHDLIGLHVNGHAAIVEDERMRIDHPGIAVDDERGRTPQRWVKISVVEAYIHCRKHIPRLVPADRTRNWGTDAVRAKGGDFFGAAARRRAPEQAVEPSPDAGRPEPGPGPEDVPADPVVGRAGAGAAS
ncbi:pyridoxamine 5'-phosphate oxidase family protein [Actinomycetospora sp.]|uniref:pyridoxamine 5'-phosphate oxidase family protein n=1 Tax=Actinomycetospora sp. TaxID=1872135 RepID=UPI002F42AAD2